MLSPQERSSRPTDPLTDFPRLLRDYTHRVRSAHTLVRVRQSLSTRRALYLGLGDSLGPRLPAMAPKPNSSLASAQANARAGNRRHERWPNPSSIRGPGRYEDPMAPARSAGMRRCPSQCPLRSGGQYLAAVERADDVAPLCLSGSRCLIVS